MGRERPEGALLAGVCAELAGRLGWNVWAIRGLLVLGLLLKTLWVGAAYLVLALLLRGLPAGTDRKSEAAAGLASPDLEARGRRIAELERKFRDLENPR